MIGTTIDTKYEVIASKGSGGFGVVYQVKDLSNGSMKAMKICTSSDSETLRRFAREVRLMESVNHQNVVKVIDSNLELDKPYLIMELAKGSLETYLPKLKSDHSLAIKVFLIVCEGIKAIHSANLVHRDIKLANVLVTDSNTVVISDLGLSKFEIRDSTILTSSNVFMGTEGYIPPEYKLPGGTKNADRRGDIYQLGKMLYNILTGENPILIDESILPPSLIFIIKKATKDRSDERYQSVDELKDAINNYVASLDVNVHPLKAFESSITAAIDLAKRGNYDRSLIKNIIASLKAGEKEQKLFFEMIDKIPYELVSKMVSDFSIESKEVFHYYDSNLQSYIDNNAKNFAYAEKIADLMKTVFYASNDIEVKTNALRNILTTSWYFNRFYAMGIFDEILQQVKQVNEAKAIAEMLYSEPEAFKGHVEQLHYTNLHVEIRNVIDFYNARPEQSDVVRFDFDS